VPIHFRCPHCDKLLALGTRQGGTQIHCPMCDRVITVPPRTQVQAPTTVVLPDAAQSWWMDAPAELPPKSEPPPKLPPEPSAPADAWWLTAQEPPVSPENASNTTPPSVPPLLPETVASAPLAEPPPNPLVFESSPKEPPAIANETLAPVERPRRKRRPAPPRLPLSYLFLVAGTVLAGIVFAAVISVWISRSNSVPTHSIDKPAGNDTNKDDKTAAPQTEESRKPSSSGPLAVKHRRETTEEELRHEAAQFPEVALDRGDDRTEAQRVQQSAAAAAHEGTPWDFASQIMKPRPDLAGLPLRPNKESQLLATAADRLHSAALALRSRLFEAAGSGTEVDADKLRTLLDAEDAPRDKWLRPEAIPALQQLLMGESAAVREVLVERLARIDGPQASIALARCALFDLHPNVRRRALEALAKRDRQHYQQALLDGLGYPWPAVADHAAEALVALDQRDAVPALLRWLDRPNPAAPYKKEGKEELYVREAVRINHLHNCLLCHAPSLKESDKLRGFVPPTGQPLPPPFTREYYGARRPGQFIRADRTYFQQDFSVLLPVKEHGKWPAAQRYDFLVRERPAPPAPASTANEYQKALFFGLRHLTGADPGPTVEDWKRWAKH
jgi:phage FluMu protein Com